jgi:hypothetical protein
MSNKNDDFSFWNINDVLSHINNNAVSFILLLCVFLIIYIVDRLTNYNTTLLMLSNAVPSTIAPQILKTRKTKSNK